MLLTEEEAKTNPRCPICHTFISKDGVCKRCIQEQERVQRFCSVPGCGKIHEARGFCNAHYKRFREGKPLDTPIRCKGKGWLSSHGYRYVGKRAMHRKIMEEKIGRKLGYNEVVHHIDGDHQNNTPSNLIVLDRGQHIKMHTLGKTNEQRASEKQRYGYCLAGRVTQ